MRSIRFAMLALCLGMLGRGYCQAPSVWGTPPNSPPLPPVHVPGPPDYANSIIVIHVAPHAIQQSVQGGLLEIVRQPDVESALRGTRVAPVPVEPMGMALPFPIPPPARLALPTRKTWGDRLNEALQGSTQAAPVVPAPVP